MTVLYDIKDHRKVLTGLRGSVWVAVFPYCIASTLISYLVFYLRYRGIDLTCNNYGHSTIALLVSFLVVARSNITYKRFWEARTHLAKLMNSARLISSQVATYAGRDKSENAQLWRDSVSRRLVTLIRTTMHVISDVNINLSLTMGDLTTLEREKVRDFDIQQKSHFISPLDLASSLQAILMSHDTYLEKKLDPIEIMQLLMCVTKFVDAYYDLAKFTNTPFPFPVVQMARTILFVWIFTLPLALVKSMTNPFFVGILMFFITYGFFGLEHVSIELHDPFGTDANDFELKRYADNLIECVEDELCSDQAHLFVPVKEFTSKDKKRISWEY